MLNKNDFAIEELIEGLNHSNYYQRWFAAEVLGTKRNLSPAQTQKLIKIAEKSDVGEVICWGLGQMKNKKAVNTISRFLEHPINYYKWRAAEALRDIGSKRAIKTLESYLKNSLLDETRWKCAWALGEIGAIDSFEALWKATQDQDRYVRWKAIWAISILKGNVEKKIKKKMVSKKLSDYMAWRSAWVLGRVGTSETAKWLKKILEQKKFKSKYVNYQIKLAIQGIYHRHEKN